MNKIAKYARRGSLLLAVIFSVVLAGTLTGTPAHVATAQSSPGATVPYVEMEAESAATNGAVTPNNWGRLNHTLTAEASGRRVVTLSSQGQYVEFTLPQQANSIVVRYSIPDSSNGAGNTGQLGLYIGGQAQTPLTVTSSWAWRYGGYQFTNNPDSTSAFQMFDEVHRLTSQMAAGTKVRLQVDSGDNVGPYSIDFADFEQVAGPIAEPSGYLSVTDAAYGADPSGATDSSNAIIAAVAAGESQGKGVYIPQGTYTITRQITNVSNVTIQGAGMWYSTLHFTLGSGSNTVGVYGNFNTGTASTNVKLSDFAIMGSDNQRVDSDQDNGIGGAYSNSTIQNIWIEHTKCGIWLDGPMDHLTIQGMRIRDTEADGVNFHKGVTNSTVTNSDLRNTGDDGLAMWSDQIADANDSFTHDTVRMVPFANEMAIYGGTNDSMTDNYIADGPDIQGGGYHVGQRFNSTTFSGTITVSRNTAVRSGALDPNWQFGVGALWFYALDANMSVPIVADSNTLIDSSYEAIMFIGQVNNVSLTNTTIDGTGTFALQIHQAGSASFSGITAGHVGSTISVGSSIYSCSGTGFVMTKGTGNGSWINDTPYCGPWPAPVYQQLATATPTVTNTPCAPAGCPTNTPTLTPSQTLTPSNTPTQTPTPSPIPGTDVALINAGGGATGSWAADTDFDQGNQFSDTSTAIDTSGYLDTNPAPQAVYQTVRWNAAFNYTIPNLTAGKSYVVLLHWAELSFQAAGSRRFNVAINGTNVLTSFDVFAAAGFKHAIAKAFNATANASGQIVIAFTQGGADNPFINGIEIISQTGGPTNTPTFVPVTNTPGPSSTPVTPTKTNTPLPSATIGSGDGTPFTGTPYAIPGKVEAENFNNGGEGIAYHDSDATNNGGQYRTTEGVDIEGTSDTGGGYDIGWSVTGEWEKYTVNVASTGSYNFDFRVASNITGGLFHMEVDNVNVTGTLTGPNTGGWQTWTDVFANNINLTAGQHVFKLFTDAGGTNYNWFNVVPASGTTATPTTPVQQLVLAIDAGGAANGSYVADTDFNAGNQFSDTSTAISTSSGLDSNPAPQGVYQTCRWNASFTYTIPGLTAGATYTVRLHWAELTFQSAGSRKFNVAINGAAVLTAFDVEATAGYKQALSRSFTTTANSSGQIVIAFTQGGADNPFISGIEILH